MSDKDKSKQKKADQFEPIFDEVEALAQQLDDPETSLDAALEIFSRGMALTKKAQALLDNAEQKVNELVEAKDERTDSSSGDDE